MRDIPGHALMELYARGSEAAFNELFRRYEGRIYGYLRRRVGSDGLADDLYQEFFVRLHRFRDRYDPARPLEPWLFRIARVVLIDQWRQQRRRAEVGLEAVELRSQEADCERLVSARQDVARALELLSAEQARIVVDSKVAGLEYHEIAGALSRSVDAVKQSASRSLRRLREAAALTG